VLAPVTMTGWNIAVVLGAVNADLDPRTPWAVS